MNNNNFSFCDDSLLHLQHLTEYPADPLYNSFILNGPRILCDAFLQTLREKLTQKYPQNEVLYYSAYDFQTFIKKQPDILRQNFHKLHPQLLAVLIANLCPTQLSWQEQEKMGLFLKWLTAHKVLVVTRCQAAVSIGFYHADHVHPEIWSWYMSGKSYLLDIEKVPFCGELKNYVTLTQDRERYRQNPDTCHTHRIGTIFPGILCQDPPRQYQEDMTVEVGFLYISHRYSLRSREAPKLRCPVCRTEQSVIVYQCIASPLSGSHLLKFYCTHCQERFVSNGMPSYYHLIHDLVL